jgi:SAM-dependent methyltransferase
MPPPISFDDGVAYERYMGKWSQLAGAVFLDWLAPAKGQRWLDVGCGNGAFTEMLVSRCAPASVHGLDPSAQQLAYARARPLLHATQLDQGDAMALPYPDAAFDVAVMPLVIFFLADLAQGVAELRRVVGAGGVAAAYAWDMLGGGFPYEILLSEMRQLGMPVPAPPSPEASRLDVLHKLWTGAGLSQVETRTIDVHRTFAGFDDFWATAGGAPSVGATLAGLAGPDLAEFKAKIRGRCPRQAGGQITFSARAHAVQGRVLM